MQFEISAFENNSIRFSKSVTLPFVLFSGGIALTICRHASLSGWESLHLRRDSRTARSARRLGLSCRLKMQRFSNMYANTDTLCQGQGLNSPSSALYVKKKGKL